MANITINALNYVKATSKEKAFSLDITKNGIRKNVVYFANIEKNDSIMNKGKQNKGCFLNSYNEIVHNLYDSKDILFHGIAARRHQYPYEDKPDYQHTYKCIADENYVPLSNDFKNIIQTQNVFYGIDNLSSYGHYHINDQYYNYLCRENQYYVPAANKIDTYIYSTELNNRQLENTVSCVLSNVLYNTIYEIPGNQYCEYHIGSMFATTVKAKNQYNALYDMKHDNDHVLKNARQYESICNCNNQIYLKYKDNLQYSQTLEQTSTTGIVFKRVGNPTSIATTSGCGNIPQIEVITNINRGINTTNHKSTLFSIDIMNKKIFDKDNADIWPSDFQYKENVINNMKLEIKNVVRQIVKNISPANSQLFAITITS